MRKPNAFMLVELVVIVAILGIMIAVAVPNFTRAEERAQVSRVRADLHMVAVALESYSADHGRYPLHGFPEEWPEPGSTYDYDYASQVLSGVITTPVAYLSSLTAMRDAYVPDYPPGTFSEQQNWEKTHYNYICFLSPWKDYNLGAQAFAQRIYGKWRLVSAGPDRKHFGHPNGGYQSVSFDPTNGTASWGDIMWTEKSSDFKRAR